MVWGKSLRDLELIGSTLTFSGYVSPCWYYTIMCHFLLHYSRAYILSQIHVIRQLWYLVYNLTGRVQNSCCEQCVDSNTLSNRRTRKHSPWTWPHECVETHPLYKGTKCVSQFNAVNGATHVCFKLWFALTTHLDKTKNVERMQNKHS